MDNISALLNDPIVLISAGGLLTVVAICAFYVFYIIKKINNNE